MDTVTLKNLSNKTIIIRKPHQEFCVKVGRCHCDSNGSSGVVHLPRKGLLRGQPREILACTDLQPHLAGPRPQVKVIKEKAPPAPKVKAHREDKPEAPKGKAKASRKRAAPKRTETDGQD